MAGIPVNNTVLTRSNKKSIETSGFFFLFDAEEKILSLFIPKFNNENNLTRFDIRITPHILALAFHNGKTIHVQNERLNTWHLFELAEKATNLIPEERQQARADLLATIVFYLDLQDTHYFYLMYPRNIDFTNFDKKCDHPKKDQDFCWVCQKKSILLDYNEFPKYAQYVVAERPEYVGTELHKVAIREKAKSGDKFTDIDRQQIALAFSK